VAFILMAVLGAVDMATKPSNRTSAALVTRRLVRPIPGAPGIDTHARTTEVAES
jgi:hypothetical protein